MKIESSLTFLSFLVLSSCVTYHKIVHSEDPEAICLDGQQAFVYMTDNSKQTQGLLVYFMGLPSFSYCGGSTISESLQNCLFVQQETTSFWKTTLQVKEGILSNQSFSSWSKIIIPYCDGALFQGYRLSSTKYKSKELFFRGNSIIKSNLAFINKKLTLEDFERIVVAGSEIGAIGALTWSRYFRDEIVLSKNTKDFKLILDSYPISYLSYQTGENQYEKTIWYLMQISTENKEHPFVLCSLRNAINEQHRCFLLEENYQYLNFPTFIIESQYDPTTISHILQINCINIHGSLSSCSEGERNFIEQLRSQRLIQLFRFANFHDNSIWSISCSSSNFLEKGYDNDSFKIKMTKPRNAAETFIFSERSTFFDIYQWPENRPCSGLL